MTHSDSGPNRHLSNDLDLDVQNLDDLRKAEQALQERERLLDSLMGLLPGSVYRALFAAFIRDVTERKRAEEEIGRLNRELRRRVDEMQAILDIRGAA
jgi:hypothetical protein